MMAYVRAGTHSPTSCIRDMENSFMLSENSLVGFLKGVLLMVNYGKYQAQVWGHCLGFVTNSVTIGVDANASLRPSK